MKTLKVSEIRPCDYCHAVGDEYYDAPTIGGPWANMCPKCCKKHGQPHTVHMGTKFVLRGPKEEKAESILAGIEASTPEDIVLEGDREIRCPNCDELHRVEPDADYKFVCEGCDSEVQTPAPIF